MTPAVIVGVLALGFLAGYASSASWLSLGCVVLSGMGVLVLLLFVLWHGGSELDDGSKALVYFQGHWISRQLSDVIALSLFLWPVGLVCGAGARHSGDASSDARQRSGTN